MEQLIQLKIQTWKVDELKYEHRGAPGSSVGQGAELLVTLCEIPESKDGATGTILSFQYLEQTWGSSSRGGKGKRKSLQHAAE